MPKLLLMLLLLLFVCSLSALVLSVSLDGSQSYVSIQEAINQSSHGDTILVYPGRYYENLNTNGKNISLASLELISGDLSYKHSTILDGNIFWNPALETELRLSLT